MAKPSLRYIASELEISPGLPVLHGQWQAALKKGSVPAIYGSC